MIKKLVILSLIVLLSGCSTKFVYNNFDWLVYWYVDDYIELNDEQEAFLDGKIAEWMTWHRGEELIKYKTQIEIIEADFTNESLTRDAILAHFDTNTAHFHRVRDKVAPSLAKMASTINEKQITYLFAALEKENVKQEKRIDKRYKGGEEKALDRRIDDIEEQLEDRIGRLTDEQKSIIRQNAPLFAATGYDWIAYRRHIQNEARKLFNTRAANPNFEADILHLMTHPDAYRSQEYLDKLEVNREQYLALILEMITTLTDKQKKKFIKELDKLMDDIDDLMEG